MAKQQIPAGGGGMEELMKQAQRMQRDMGDMQEKLKKRVVEAKAGGGAVRVTINGAREVLAIKIDEELVDEDDVETLEDTVLAAVNAALQKVEALVKKEMEKATGGLNLPGLM